MPTKEQIASARKAAGLSQTAAAKLIGCKSYRTWQNWEYGINAMRPGLWEYFLLRVKDMNNKRKGR